MGVIIQVLEYNVFLIVGMLIENLNCDNQFYVIIQDTYVNIVNNYIIMLDIWEGQFYNTYFQIGTTNTKLTKTWR